MSSAPVRGIVPQRQRRHHHHHYHEKHERNNCTDHNQDFLNNQLPGQQPVQSTIKNNDSSKKEEIEEKRPKVNPIFLWAAQREQRIVEVRCEDYDKRNRIKLTKTAQGWRSIPRTALTAYPIIGSVIEDEGEQQENLSKTSKNEEKENSSRKLVKLKQVGVDALEDTRVNDVSRLGKVDETEQERERHTHKRKKHSDLSKNKKRKTDSEAETLEADPFDETLVTTNWKMKKRRKVDKNKKRKKMCIEEAIVHKNKIDNLSEIKIKQESKKEVISVDKINNIEDINTTETIEHKMDIKKGEKTIEFNNEYRKCDNLEKLHKNGCLQPRVVLEQLHLSQLPTRIHRRFVNRTELRNNAEQNEGNSGNNINEIVEDNVENSNRNNESRIDPENEEDIVDKEDLQEILNMLDSNNFPINIDETKTNLIESKDVPRSCTKLGAAILTTNQKDETIINISPIECAKNEHDLTVYEKRSKFRQRDNLKQRVGSKSLDETIERLERSINYQKRIGSVPNILTIEEYEINKQKANKSESNPEDNISNWQDSIMPNDHLSILRENTYEGKNTEKDIIESSKILDALRNTPGLSVSLAINGRKHNAFTNAISNSNNILPSSRSPDSQTEVAEKISKSLPGISVVVPAYQHRSKTISPILKHRVESPESTVDFPKYEQCSCETNDCETDEDESFDSHEISEEIKNQNNYKRRISKCIHQNYEDYHTYYDDDSKNYSINSTKVPNLKPLLQVVSRNSEAQAKYSSLPRYQEVNNYDEHTIEEFNSQVSPQPSGIPYTISSRRSSSAYLERLLPSPPCSVSCSEDAKNDLTLKGILSSPNNVDSRNLDKKEQTTDLNIQCDSDLSPSYNHSDERFSQESPVSAKTLVNQESERLSQEKIKYLETKTNGRPMSSGDVDSAFTTDYVSPKRPLSAEWTVNQQRMQNGNGYFPSDIRYVNQKEFINRLKVQESYISPTIFLDPASQLRELIKTSGHLIPDPLLVPRDYLPLLAGAPLTEIPKLLATRPELRLPEALTRPELLRDPDLLVISLAHLQHVLDHGEGLVTKAHYSNQPMLNPANDSGSVGQIQEEKNEPLRPKLSCKPIDKLMPAPMDLSNNQKLNSHPPLLRVRSGLLKQEPEVSSTASSPDDSQLWHPLFGSQKQRQQQHQQQPQQQQEQHQRRQQQQLQQPQQQQEQHQRQQQQQHTSWHRTTLAS